VGNDPTFERGVASSVIDVTFYRNVVVSDWNVLNSVSLSDHHYLEFTVSTLLNRSAPVAVPAQSDNISSG